MKYSIMLTLLVTICNTTMAQGDTVRLTQASFEQEAHRGNKAASSSIEGWFDCGMVFFPNESPPDIHPGEFWEVNLPAKHGDTYLGMVTRENETYESISQKLQKTLQAGNCYSISLYMAQSAKYISASRLEANKMVNHAEPTILRIWGGGEYCRRQELLASTVAIDHQDWKRYDLTLSPTENINSITVEAYWDVPVVTPYAGHILLDHMSPIVWQSCED